MSMRTAAKPAASKTPESVVETKADPVASARAAGLRYVNDSAPGFSRRKQGGGFVYLDANGKRITDDETLARIKSLVIPPAWTDVWICPSANGHIQAIGYDARGRKQYRYHPRWREVRDEAKYGRMTAFADALPKLRRRVQKDLKRPGLPREKVLAAIVRLLETTFIRVGNEEYAKTNHSYGLTTIHNKHVQVKGSTIHFEFRGKSGVDHEIDLEDAHLARIVRKCQDLPEQELFEYVDDAGVRHDIKSDDVNEYLKEISGHDFTAKDFRTWAGTVLAALALQEFESFDSKAQAKRNVVAAVERVAKRLGNTKAVCRKCYIHPAVIESYLDGTMAEALQHRAEQRLASTSLHGMRAEEAAVLALLQERLKREAAARRKSAA
jgi:DNA topoisomerase-1